jgi:hypothetical protein
MHGSRVLQFLSIPAALGLGTALVIACSDGSPTSPDNTVSPAETVTPFAAPKKGHTGGGAVDNLVVDDPNSCPDGYFYDTVNNPGSGADTNDDGIICGKRATKK